MAAHPDKLLGLVRGSPVLKVWLAIADVPSDLIVVGLAVVIEWMGRRQQHVSQHP